MFSLIISSSISSNFLKKSLLNSFPKLKPLLKKALQNRQRFEDPGAFRDPLIPDYTIDKWSKEIIEQLDLKKSFFPEVKPTGSKLNYVTSDASRQTGLPTDCIVGVGGHDHPLGVLITGAIKYGVMSNSIGTAECLVTGIEKPSFDLRLIDLGLVEHVIVSPDRKYYYLFGF